jgi:hypothetical protein
MLQSLQAVKALLEIAVSMKVLKPLRTRLVPSKDCVYEDDGPADPTKAWTLREEHWSVVADMVKVLKPVRDAVMSLQADNVPTTAIALHKLRCMLHALSTVTVDSSVASMVQAQLLKGAQEHPVLSPVSSPMVVPLARFEDVVADRAALWRCAAFLSPENVAENDVECRGGALLSPSEVRCVTATLESCTAPSIASSEDEPSVSQSDHDSVADSLEGEHTAAAASSLSLPPEQLAIMRALGVLTPQSPPHHGAHAVCDERSSTPPMRKHKEAFAAELVHYAELKRVQSLAGKYYDKAKTARCPSTNPLDWWNQKVYIGNKTSFKQLDTLNDERAVPAVDLVRRRHRLPLLFASVLRLMSVESSAGSERTFSTVGNIVTPTRTRLHTDTIEAVVHLKQQPTVGRRGWPTND